MKSLAIALLTVLSVSANAGVLTCKGSTEDKKLVWVIIDSGNKFLTVNGRQETAQFSPGPVSETLTVTSPSAFVGISTKSPTEAMINTAIFDQVPLKCDGQKL